MRVFVTGASGWIGSAVVPELLAAGHTVLGLARSDASAAKLEAAGAEVHRGDLHDLDALRSGAADADGVIHLAFDHSALFSGDFAGAAASDRAAIDTFGDELAGSDRPLLIASGIAMLKPGEVLLETDTPGEQAIPRARSEVELLGLAARGVRSASVRLAPTVHGEGDHGFIALITAAAREHGVSGYVGDGANRWTAIHRTDAARVFVSGLESAPAGSVLHATAEEGVPFRDIAEAIGTGLGLETRPVDPSHFGFLAGLVGADMPASSVATQSSLDWTPTGPTLLEDLAAGHYTR